MQCFRVISFVIAFSVPSLAQAQDVTVPATIKQLDCSALTVSAVHDFHNRFGILPKDWSAKAEQALSDRIDACFPPNMKSSSAINSDLQTARQQAHLDELGVVVPQATEETKRLNDIEQQRLAEIAKNKAENTFDPQVSAFGEQLFVEKHCPMLEPDHDMFASLIQNSDVKFVDPALMSEDMRSKGQPFLTYLETKTDESRGFKAGSPIDVRFKCTILASALGDTLHLYKLRH